MGACSDRMQGTARSRFFCILGVFPDLIPNLNEQGCANRASQCCAISLDFPNTFSQIHLGFLVL